VIVRVTAQETYPLRQQVLRPHQSIAEVGFPGEDDPATAHFAQRDAGGRIVGIVTVLRQDPPAPPITAEELLWWRLRGMATAEDHRGQGVGMALVQAAVAHVAAQQATGLWCNARLSAVGFYRKAGFVTTGEVWEEPGLGPHIRMWRPLPHPGEA
jgi:predicted GNAT family N-acyltransferase